MTYPSKLSPEAEAILAPVKERVSALEEGAYLVFEDSGEGIAKFRYHLYSWLFIGGLKEYYRVKQLSPESLMITRLRTAQAPSMRSSLLSPVETFVRDELIEVLEEADALAEIKKAILSGKLRVEDYDTALSEWRRVNG